MPLKNKKFVMLTISFFCVVIIGFLGDTFTNNKLSELISLSFLYFKNSEEINYNGISMKIPFYYIKRQNKKYLTLSKFPKGDGVIFIRKEYLSKEKFYEIFKAPPYQTTFNLISEGEVRLDNETGYFISAVEKSDPTAYREHITIPGKKITLFFIGDEKNSKDFWNIVKQSKFLIE